MNTGEAATAGAPKRPARLKPFAWLVMSGFLLSAVSLTLPGCGPKESTSGKKAREPVAASGTASLKELPKSGQALHSPAAAPDESVPDSTVIIPPDEPGGPGITLGEWKQMREAALKHEQEIDPDSLEIIPPDMSGGRGITLGEFKQMREAALKHEQEIDPDSLEMIPADEPGGPDVTVREFKQMREAALEQEREMDRHSMEMIPAGEAGGPGMSLGEYEALRGLEPSPHQDLTPAPQK